MRKPPWKAENARIRKEMAARKKPEPVPFTVVQVPLRRVSLKASWIFEDEMLYIPEETRKNMARQIIARKLVEELEHEFISMECSRRTGGEKWTGTLEVLK